MPQQHLGTIYSTPQNFFQRKLNTTLGLRIKEKDLKTVLQKKKVVVRQMRRRVVRKRMMSRWWYW